jgi:hypothetical protein
MRHSASFHFPPGVFTSFMSPVVTIHAEVGASIHYTTDGSTPTADSPVYNSSKGGVRLQETTTIKAVAVKKRSASAATERCFVVSPQGPIDVLLVAVPQAAGAAFVATFNLAHSFGCCPCINKR